MEINNKYIRELEKRLIGTKKELESLIDSFYFEREKILNSIEKIVKKYSYTNLQSILNELKELVSIYEMRKKIEENVMEFKKILMEIKELTEKMETYYKNSETKNKIAYIIMLKYVKTLLKKSYEM